ncbi:unnamed protein product, partial [Laminaria digitata]
AAINLQAAAGQRVSPLKCNTCMIDFEEGVAYHPCGDKLYTHVDPTVCIEGGTVTEDDSTLACYKCGAVNGPLRMFASSNASPSCDRCFLLLRRGFLKKSRKHFLNKSPSPRKALVFNKYSRSPPQAKDTSVRAAGATGGVSGGDGGGCDGDVGGSGGGAGGDGDGSGRGGGKAKVINT